MAQPGQITADLGNLLVHSLEDRWRTYSHLLKRCQKKYSEEVVHDLRVSTRRLISMLDLLMKIMADDRLKKIRRTLKKRLDMFDPLRDTQVQMLTVETWLTDFPELQGFSDRLSLQERQLVKQLSKGVKKLGIAQLEKTLTAMQKQLRTLFSDPARRDETFVAVIDAVEATFAKVVERRRHIDPAEPATIHHTRVAFKKFRYMLEVLQPLLAEVTNEKLQQMQSYQTRMGDIQDVEVLTANLNNFLSQANADTASSLVPVRQELARRRTELIDRFMNSTDELFSFWNHDHLRINPEFISTLKAVGG